MSIKVRPVSKEFAHEHILEIAALRIKVFKDFPYIYDGSVEYEVKYLDRYFKAPNGTFILAIDENAGNKIVGVATALPLIEEDDFVKKSFIENGGKIDETRELPALRLVLAKAWLSKRFSVNFQV